MNQYALTKIRAFQWILIILVLCAVAGGYFYYRSGAAVTLKPSVGSATVNKSSNSSITSGLVGHWTFDGADTTTTTATDRSGNSNTGTLTGTNSLISFWSLEETSGTRADSVGTNTLADNNTVTSAAGKVGTAGQFTAANSESLSIADNASLSAGDIDFMITAWVYWDSETSNMTIVSKWDASADEYTLYRRQATDTLEFGVRDSSSNFGNVSWGQALAANTWYFVVAYHDSVSNVIGIQVNNGTPVTTAWTTGVRDGTNPFRIGSTNQIGGYEFWDGRIDQVGFYKRILTTDERTALYNSGNGRSFAETPHGPVSVRGQIGQALDFDGSDDYIVIPNPEDSPSPFNVSDSADLTLTGWFYRDTATTDDTIIAKRNGTSAPASGYIAYLDDADDKLYFEVSDGTDEYQLASTTTFTSAGWQHYTIVWDQDSASNSEIYINGVADTATDTGTIGNIGSLSNSITLVIGSEAESANHMDGRLDDVRIYNRALSTAEIQSLYALGESDKVNAPQGDSLTQGLAGYYKLDEGSGTSAADASGNARTGTLTSGPTWNASGKMGSAVTFDGNDDYISLGQNYNFTSEDFSIGFWINALSLTTPGCCGPVPFWKGSFETAGYYMQINANGAIVFMTSQSGAAQYSNSFPVVQTGGWHHILATRKGSAVTLYYDGRDVTNTRGTHINPASASSNNFQISRYFTSNVDTLLGSIDEFRVYNRTLSAEEASRLYRTTAPQGVETTLKGYWSFNGPDVSGTTAYDRSSSGNNGTLTNGPIATVGKIGQALSFDGTNDYVIEAGTTQAKFTGSFSYGAWIRPLEDQDNQQIMGFASGSSFRYQMYIDNGGTESLGCEVQLTGGLLTASAITTVVTNNWYHLFCVYDDTAKVAKLYVNGTLFATSATGSGSLTDGGLGDQKFQVGRNSLQNTFWNAIIDEVRVYNAALTAAEVTNLYNLGR